jgi:hypothetical protein
MLQSVLTSAIFSKAGKWIFVDKGDNKPINQTMETLHSFCLWLKIWCGTSGENSCTSHGRDPLCEVAVLERLCSSM